MSPFQNVIAFRNKARSKVLSAITMTLVATGVSARAQEAQLKTADAVLERYEQALGGVEAIQKVQSMTVRGEAESSARPGKSSFVYYARPFKSLMKLTVPMGLRLLRDSMAKFHGPSRPKAQASTKTLRLRPSVVTKICNMRCTSRIIFRNSNWRA